MEEALQLNEGSDFNFEQELISFIDNHFPPDLKGTTGEMTREIHDSYISAIEKNDTEKLTKLLEVLENKIAYLMPKYRDTQEQKEYIKKLEQLHEQLMDKITSPE